MASPRHFRRLPAVRVKRQQPGTIPNDNEAGDQPVKTVGPPIIVTQRTTFIAPPVSSVIKPTSAPLPVISSPLAPSVVTQSSSTSPTPPVVTQPPSPSPPIAVASSSFPQSSPSIIAGGVSTPYSDMSSASDNKNDTGKSSNSNGLSGGAIGGIVLGIVLLLLALAFFLFRRRQLQKRQGKRNNAPWLAKGGIEGGPDGSVVGGYSFPMDEEKYPVPATNLPPLQPVRGPYPYAAASNAVPFDDVPISPVSPRTKVPPPIPVPVVVTPPASASPASSLVTVRCTFIPTLPDELHIAAGDALRIVQEYDDGWAYCIKANTGVKGMVPVECFDKDSRLIMPGAGEYSVSSGGQVKADKRASSLVGTGIRGRI